MQIAYYPGCSLKQSSNLYDIQTRKIFAYLGVNLQEINDWNCCGATSAGKTNDFMALAMPARNIGLAEAAGFSEIVIPCSACYLRTIVSKNVINDNPALKKKINSSIKRKFIGDIKILNILEALEKVAGNGKLKKSIKYKIKGLNPVCYYGCMLTRFPYNVEISDNVENPQAMENMLKSLGIHTIDWNYKTSCCGASAAINDRKTSLNLMAKILSDAIQRGADCIVTTCPMCQMNLDSNQDEICENIGCDQRLPVYFITELLGMAMGMSIQELQINRHFIDGTQLLKELELK